MRFSTLRLLLLVTLALAPSATFGLEFFVSPSGNDSWSGTSSLRDEKQQTGPFATLERARDEIRKHKTGGTLTSPVTVTLLEGNFPRQQTFELTTKDSGDEKHPITYRALPGHQVRLLGGKPLTQWTSVTEQNVLARLPEPARKQVLQCDLKAAGIANFGTLTSRGFGRPTHPAHLELFFRNQPMTLARWPNNGEFTQIAGFPSDQKEADGHGGDLGKLEGGFLYSGDRPANWKSLDNVWVHGYWAWDWANSYERIASLDPKTHLIKTAVPHGLYGFRKGQRIYFLNVLEELDQPGEYFVDTKQGLVYFWPPSPISENDLLASILEKPLIQLTDVSHVTLQGITLEATRGVGLVINKGHHNTISGCLIRMIGSQGVQISGGEHHQMIGCDVRDCGDGGVSVSGGDRQTLARGNHAVLNSHFERQGRWSKCYVPAINFSGVGLRAAHNLIHDHPHCAIQFVGNDHTIEFNEIHHVALETGDVGVIYTGRDWTYRGHLIRHNFIHRIGGVGMGSMGVYMDDCTSSAEIIGNIFYQSSRAMMIGGGRDYLVKNNIFIDCKPAIHFDARGMSPAPVWSDMVQKFMRQRLNEIPAELYRQRYPRIADLDPYYAKNAGIPPENNRLENNIAVGGTWIETWNTKPDWLTQVGNSVGPDPGFVSTKRDRPADFLLKPDSPLLKAGFQQIPVEKIGLQKDEHRQLLPK